MECSEVSLVVKFKILHCTWSTKKTYDHCICTLCIYIYEWNKEISSIILILHSGYNGYDLRYRLLFHKHVHDIYQTLVDCSMEDSVYLHVLLLWYLLQSA